MTYISKADAVTKLTASKQDHSCTNLYSNNLLFNSTTIFYTDSAKTITAPAGNYVIPTNHNSIFMTLDSAGKIVGSISHTDGQTLDTNWVDDRIYSSGVLVSNQGSIGGTNLTISGNSITDNVWTSRPYTYAKKWQINNGSLNSTPLTNIDLTDMKGYDLMIYTGEYNNCRWVDNNWVQAFCHIKADTNRQSIFGNKIYYFKPDYWIPNSAFTGGVTFFRRMPNITTINDRYGNKKFWIDMADPVHDFAENYGIPRTPTKMNKGITHSEVKSAYGYNFTPSKDKKFTFTGDAWIINPISFLYLGYIDTNYMQSIWSDYFQNWAVALIESLVVDDYTWANGVSSQGFAYSTANPYHWKTTPGSGSGAYAYSPLEFLKSYFYSTSSGNGDQLQFDAEYYYKSIYSSLFGQAFNELHIIAKNQVLYGINEIANGAVDVNFSSYAGGVYSTAGGGSGTTGWSSINSSNVVGSDLYNHYHNYYINGSVSYSSVNPNNLFIGSPSAYSMSYITNYQIDPLWQFSIYCLVHNYDISKKIFTQLWGTANHATRVMIYTWIRQDVIGSGGGNSSIRNTLPYQGGARPEQSPALNQSLGVWAMAYADGFFAWNDGTEIDELNTTDVNGQLGRASWDWAYVGYWQVWQNRDIVEANTSWLVPDYQKSVGVWTSGNENYPVHLYANQRPICRYKLSADGGTALVICTNPFNNGYTKATHTFRLPSNSNYSFTIDTWGTYTSVIRLTGLPTT